MGIILVLKRRQVYRDEVPCCFDTKLVEQEYCWFFELKLTLGVALDRMESVRRQGLMRWLEVDMV